MYLIYLCSIIDIIVKLHYYDRWQVDRVKRQNVNTSPQRSSDDDGSSLSGSQSETDHSDFQRRTPLEQLLASPKRPKADPPLTVVQVFASPT